VAESQRDRFYVQKDKHPTFQRLSRKDEGPFDHLKDAFVFAAAMGFRFERRVPIEGGSQHVGFWHYLSEAREVPLIQAIAIASTGDLAVLEDRGDVIAIAEEYANGGIDLVTDLERLDRDATLVSLATEVLELSHDLVPASAEGVPSVELPI
jgi:dnd system-associated protein 4